MFSIKIPRLRVFASLALFIAGFGLLQQVVGSTAGSSPSRSSEPPTVSVCELIKKPDLYDRKTVRLSAVYLRTDRYTRVFDLFLYDPDCGSEKFQLLLLGLEFEHWDKLREQMWKMFPAEKCDRAELIAIGKFVVFESPVPYRDFVKYGFEISQFESGRCLAKDDAGN
jgi:hypothetical protein